MTQLKKKRYFIFNDSTFLNIEPFLFQPCFEPEFRTPIVKSQHKSVEKRTLLDDMEDSNGGDFSS